MAESQDGEICGLPSWTGLLRNDTATAYMNNTFLAAVNGPFAIFAFLSNLAIIVTVIKTPSLQKPCNILLCGLAFTDCLTGITCQPLFIAWRLLTLQRARQSCLHLVLIFNAYYISHMLTVGLSFLNVLIISFDRQYAVSKPLIYISNASKKGKFFPKIIGNYVLLWLNEIFIQSLSVIDHRWRQNLIRIKKWPTSRRPA